MLKNIIKTTSTLCLLILIGFSVFAVTEKVIFETDNKNNLMESINSERETNSVIKLSKKDFEKQFPNYNLVKVLHDKNKDEIIYEAKTDKEYQKYLKKLKKRELEDIKEKKKEKCHLKIIKYYKLEM